MDLKSVICHIILLLLTVYTFKTFSENPDEKFFKLTLSNESPGLKSEVLGNVLSMVKCFEVVEPLLHV